MSEKSTCRLVKWKGIKDIVSLEDQITEGIESIILKQTIKGRHGKWGSMCLGKMIPTICKESIAKFIMVQDCGWGLLWVIINSHIH